MLKTRRLNDTDFARTTVLSEDQQWTRLLHMTASFAPYSLAPVRQSFPDIFNQELPLFERFSHVHGEITQILSDIDRRSRSAQEGEQNQEAAILLHSFSTSQVQISRDLPYRGLRLGEFRAFWQPRYLVVDGQIALFHVDPRGAAGLTADARRVYFSAMDVGVRQVDPDFENARLLVVQLPRGKSGLRSLKLHWGDAVDLMSYDELQARSAVTERLWLAAQEEQERRRRHSKPERTGTLL